MVEGDVEVGSGEIQEDEGGGKVVEGERIGEAKGEDEEGGREVVKGDVSLASNAESKLAERGREGVKRL